MTTRWWRRLLLLVPVALVVLISYLPAIVDRQANKTYDGDLPRDLTVREGALHRSLFIVDLHADTLLWDREILARSGRGHADLPRLLEANVALQVFSVVTKVPMRTRRVAATGRDENCHAADGLDSTALLRMVQAKPLRQWFDGEAAALAQAARLQALAAESRARHATDPASPELMLVLDATDLSRLIERRLAGEAVVGGLLALEGTHWIEGDAAAVPAAVERLFAAGFRMAAPIHRFDNALGQSSEGCGDGPPLSEAGAVMLREVERRGMIVDLAHASDASLLAALKGRQSPAVVSHTGIRRLCDARKGCRIARNLGDEEVRAIARTGGVVGIGYWTGAVGRGVARIVDAFEAALDVLAAPDFVAEMRSDGRRYEPLEHLALGSDFDGASLTPFDVSKLDGLTAALVRRSTAGKSGRRFDEGALRLIAGANACRVMALTLPKGGPDMARRICDPLRADWRTILPSTAQTR